MNAKKKWSDKNYTPESHCPPYYCVVYIHTYVCRPIYICAYVCIYALIHVSEGWRHCGSIGHTEQIKPNTENQRTTNGQNMPKLCARMQLQQQNALKKILDYIVFYRDMCTKARKQRHSTAETTAIRPRM